MCFRLFAPRNDVRTCLYLFCVFCALKVITRQMLFYTSMCYTATRGHITPWPNFLIANQYLQYNLNTPLFKLMGHNVLHFRTYQSTFDSIHSFHPPQCLGWCDHKFTTLNAAVYLHPKCIREASHKPLLQMWCTWLFAYSARMWHLAKIEFEMYLDRWNILSLDARQVVTASSPASQNLYLKISDKIQPNITKIVSQHCQCSQFHWHKRKDA